MGVTVYRSLGDKESLLVGAKQQALSMMRLALSVQRQALSVSRLALSVQRPALSYRLGAFVGGGDGAGNTTNLRCPARANVEVLDWCLDVGIHDLFIESLIRIPTPCRRCTICVVGVSFIGERCRGIIEFNMPA